MADKEIGDLTAATALTGSETFHIVQSGNSRKATPDQIATRVVDAEKATKSQAEAGTNNAKIMTPQRVNEAVSEWGHAPNVIAEHQESSGTDGGSFPNGSDQTRPLNTLVRNRGTLASLSSNQLTLPAGTYYIEWWSRAHRVQKNQSFLYNVTDAAEVSRGSTERSGDLANSSVVTSRGAAVVTIAGSRAFELRHRAQTTRNTDGFGEAAGFGTEVYAQLTVTKVPD